MIELTPRLKLIAAAILALVVGFLVGTFVLTVPSPRVIGLDKTQTGISLHGATSRGSTVLVFAHDGALIDVVQTSASGQFLIEGLNPATGTTDIILRALNSGWRASPPTHVDLAGVMASEISTTTSTSATTPEDTDLPPPGIPPTSTHPKVETPTSTAHEVQTIAAFASVANASIASKATQTVIVTVKDQTGSLVTGADVQVIAHYPTEDITYNAAGDGTYRVKFKVPENIGTGTNVLLDIKAVYEDLSSTARTVFTLK